MPIARSSDPETSHEAAESVTHVRRSQAAVLGVLAFLGPSTDNELISDYEEGIAKYGLPQQSPSGIRTRRAELVRDGLVKDSGKRTWLPSGRRAIVWELA